MNKGKTQEYGTVNQVYTLTLRYCRDTRKDGIASKETIERKADLDVEPYRYGSPFQIHSILDFQKGANAILKETKAVLAEGLFVEVELSVSAYEDVPEHPDPSATCAIRSTINQIAFDMWTFKGYGDESHEDEEEGGLYLQPDTRYTDECRDIFILWKQDILEALAESHL